MTRYTKTEQKLIDGMSEMDIIDCHEHLPPEKQRTDSPQDVFTLFSHYTRCDLFSAGMDRASYQDIPSFGMNGRKEYESLFDYSIPLEKRWRTFEPYWRRIRHGSYARAAILTAKLVYDFDDINEQTYQELSEKIAAENTPGIYRRMLCDRCRIRAALTQCSSTEVERPLVPVMPGRMLSQIRTRQLLDKLAADLGQETPVDLDGYLHLGKAYLDKWVAQGAIGIKFVSQPNLPPDRSLAEAAFKRMVAGEELVPDAQAFEVLENFVMHQVIDMAAELGLVIAVHAGIWGDFRNLDCKHMLTIAPGHPQATFDLYHLGMPAVRDCIVIAKNLPNVYLNLAWCHIISQAQTCSGVDELLDQVPINKVLAFGGDYGRSVEKVVGHLHMAREDFAAVFGRRIDRGRMSFDEAMEILRMWFWENPLDLYPRLEIAPNPE